MSTGNTPLNGAGRPLEALIGDLPVRWYGVLDGELISLDEPGVAPLALPARFEPHELHCQLTTPPVDVFVLGGQFALTVRTEAMTSSQRASCRALAAVVAAMRPFRAAPGDAAVGAPAAWEGMLELFEGLAATPTAAALSDRLLTDLSGRPWMRAVAVGTPTASGDALELDGHLPHAEIEGAPSIRDPLVAASTANGSVQEFSLQGATSANGLRRWARGHGATQLWAVPLASEQLVHAVLLCGVDQAPRVAARLMQTVGAVGGRLLQAHRQANTMVADGERDIVIEYHGMDGPVQRLAAALETEVTLPQLSMTQPHVVVAFGQLHDVSIAAIQSAVASIDAITKLQPIVDGEDPLIAMHVVDPGFHAAVSSLGPYLEAVTVADSVTTVRYCLPPSMPQQELLRQIEAVVGDGELRAVGAGSSTPRLPWTQLLRSRLTDQQVQILATAYHAGYYGPKRPLTGTELAELLGMAQPTFSGHLRAGLQRLLSGVFAETADPLADVFKKKE